MAERFRPKPDEIEAQRYQGEGTAPLPFEGSAKYHLGASDRGRMELRLKTPWGWRSIRRGDWVIRTSGGCYALDPHVFAAIFERVPSGDPHFEG